MTAKCALIKALLAGEVLNVKNVFTMIGLTNCAREISRMVEKPFNVVVSRTTMTGKSRYGQPVSWVNYRLNTSEHNLTGIKEMWEYVKSQQTSEAPRTEKEIKIQSKINQTVSFAQQQLFFNEG